MNKRVVAALGAVLFAVIGIFALLSYVSNVDERAYAGTKLESVYQVTDEVAANTAGDKIGGSVKKVSLPASAIAKNAVRDLDDIAGLKATAALMPGEQLILSRFNGSGITKKSAGTSGVPAGMQEVTIALNVSRSAADRIDSDTLVGVVASYGNEGDKEGKTAMIANKVRVTHVDEIKGSEGSQQQPGTLVTLAVNSTQAAKIVNAAEFGRVWLLRQNEATKPEGLGTIQPKDVAK